ncbi:transglutaminase-like putative cysteine protease [Elusimicrobium posterum]|uniref:transglutaminase-like domain-containing protein n=1 Tax=Elusimicrobium posterum TaxID=3116653 RepID=UPI003C73DEFA
MINKLEPLSSNIEDYLKSDEYVNFKKPCVFDKSNELLGALSSDSEKIKTAFEFVRDQIHHTADIKSKRVTKTAAEVLKYSEGICYAKSLLLAALLRAQNIPCGFCYQKLTLDDTPDSGYCIHALNAVYLKEKNAWARIDSRGNTNGKNAQFYPKDPLKEQLAFTVRAEYGEKDLPGIYAEHPAAVIKPLITCTDALEMMQKHLPQDL